MDELLTVKQVAAQYECSTATVYARIKDGSLTPLRAGRTILIRRSEIDAICARNIATWDAKLAARREAYARLQEQIASREWKEAQKAKQIAAAKARAERTAARKAATAKAKAEAKAQKLAAKQAYEEEWARFLAECKEREAAYLATVQARLVALRAEREAQGLAPPPLYGNEDWITLRKAVIRRDGYICQLCGRRVDPRKLDIDHIVPRSKGGLDTLDNLRVAHAYCNRARGNRENWTPGWYNSDPTAYED